MAKVADVVRRLLDTLHVASKLHSSSASPYVDSMIFIFVIAFLMILEQLQIAPAIVWISFTPAQDRFDHR